MEKLSHSETAAFERVMDAHDRARATTAVREELNRIALDDLTRKRSKLGTLSTEQELAVQALFLSTIARIPGSALLHLRATLKAQSI